MTDRPSKWDGRPYAREEGWTGDHRAFRDWLMNEFLLAGCEVRTLSPLGMAQVTVEHMVRQGWSATQVAGSSEAMRRAAGHLRNPYLCNWNTDVAAALADWLDDHANGGTGDAKATAVADALLASFGAAAQGGTSCPTSIRLPT